jgi:hypothetical protein
MNITWIFLHSAIFFSPLLHNNIHNILSCEIVIGKLLKYLICLKCNDFVVFFYLVSFVLFKSLLATLAMAAAVINEDIN